MRALIDINRWTFFGAMEVVMVVGSMLGAALLAFNVPYSKFGYVLFLLSSLCGIYVGQKIKLFSLTLLQTFFSIVNVIGVYRWM